MRNLASLKTPKLIIHCVCDVETPGFVKVKKCNLPCGWFFKPPVKVDQTARWFIALITPSWLYSWCVDPHLSCVNLYANLVPLRTLWLRSEGQQQLSGNKSSFLLQLAVSPQSHSMARGPLKTSSICFCSKTISSHQERQPQSCKTSIFFNSMNVILLHLKMQLAEWECKSSKRESQEQPKGDEIPMPTLHLETILCWTVLETRAPGLSLDGFKRGPLGHHLPPTQTTLKF